MADARLSSYCAAMNLVDRTLAEVVDLFAAREPAPGGGSAAALAGALAAALTEMSAAFALTSLRSTHDAQAVTGANAGAASGAAAARRGGSFARLAAADAAAESDPAIAADPHPDLADHEARLVEVRDRAHELRGELLSLAEDDTRSYAPVLDALAIERSDPDRPARLRAALSAAADVPLAVAVAAAEVGELAFAAAQSGNAHLLGDATVGAVIAEAAARSAARLVELNLAACPQDARLGRAEAAAQRAWGARVAVLGGNDAQGVGAGNLRALRRRPLLPASSSRASAGCATSIARPAWGRHRLGQTGPMPTLYSPTFQSQIRAECELWRSGSECPNQNAKVRAERPIHRDACPNVGVWRPRGGRQTPTAPRDRAQGRRGACSAAQLALSTA